MTADLDPFSPTHLADPYPLYAQLRAHPDDLVEIPARGVAVASRHHVVHRILREHHSYRSLGDHLARMERYARMMAVHMHAQGRRAHLFNLFVNPFWRFLRGYVLRAGFLDGWRGLIYACIKSNYVRQKFIKLWLLNRGYPI